MDRGMQWPLGTKKTYAVWDVSLSVQFLVIVRYYLQEEEVISKKERHHRQFASLSY